MNRLTRIGISVALAGAATLAISQAPPGGGGPGGPPNPEAQARTAIETRQAAFKLIGNQNNPIGGMNRPNAPAPDLAVVARNAARIQMLADMLPDLFTANTTAVTTVKTRALPGIWTSAADFKTKAEALSKSAGVLADAAKKGDATAAKAAATEMGRACASCHDAYRGPA
jgi:cytochrome c556